MSEIDFAALAVISACLAGYYAHRKIWGGATSMALMAIINAIWSVS